MKKIVIAGSAKLQKEANSWLNFFSKKNYEILDHPKSIEKQRFMELYPNIHIEFLQNIVKTDVLFIMNCF